MPPQVGPGSWSWWTRWRRPRSATSATTEPPVAPSRRPPGGSGRSPGSGDRCPSTSPAAPSGRTPMRCRAAGRQPRWHGCLPGRSRDQWFPRRSAAIQPVCCPALRPGGFGPRDREGVPGGRLLHGREPGSATRQVGFRESLTDHWPCHSGLFDFLEPRGSCQKGRTGVGEMAWRADPGS